MYVSIRAKRTNRLTVVPPSHRIVLNLHDAGLAIDTNSDAWADWLRWAYQHFLVEKALRDTFHLRIVEDGNLAPPPDLPLTWEGVLQEGWPARIFETETTWTVEIAGRGFAHIDRAARRAEIHARPGERDTFVFTPLTVILDVCLSGSGQQMIHAACLKQQDADAAFLVCAPSGTGKTTSALALAREGFPLMSDDAAILAPDAAAPRVWAIPHEFKVHRKTLAMLPWLGPLPGDWNADDEQAVRVDHLEGRAPVARCRPVPLRAIFFLVRGDNAQARTAPMNRQDALIEIARDNVAISPSGVPPWQASQFEIFGRIVRDVPVFRLEIGSDLTSLGVAVAQTLAEKRT
ncbi:hypothetical protein ACKTEK_04655 [Tepidamorphus sp. 3E244]|uniref:hypothetical protein n=1 Tax=Tepidamorphus sp. 3E244 TaxID=3385498 RepID=UPI0038FC15C1